MLYFLLSTLVLTLYIDVVLSLSNISDLFFFDVVTVTAANCLTSRVNGIKSQGKSIVQSQSRCQICFVVTHKHSIRDKLYQHI